MTPNSNINVDLSTMPNIKCEECDCEFFVPTFVIKHIHALMAPSGKDTMIPLQIFRCNDCGNINELFLSGLTN